MNGTQKLAAAITIAVMIGLAACSNTPETATDTKSETSLAATVQTNLDTAYPEGFPTDDLLFALTDIEDVSEGTVRVFVQFELNETEREAVADQVHGLGYTDALEVVVVRDASGVDSNHFYY